MAAAAVAGLIPVLHSVAGDKSSYYVGRQLWFGFIAVYGVVVYVVRMPWADLHQDFWCHGSITYPCLIECFESSFSSPVVGLWYFFFFLFLAFFFLMEFFMAQVRHKQIKAKLVESEAADVEEGSMVGVQEQAPSPKKAAPNFHQEKALLLLYLVHFLLQVRGEREFMDSARLRLTGRPLWPCLPFRHQEEASLKPRGACGASPPSAVTKRPKAASG
ncbi:uncharacterized protein [Vicugna pacos]|uniref:Uncharacterized protein isoform X2 n=1 Tax=Vicugna pacos TaxID=30538 RepID=A0ABM5CPT1_VICPA